MQIQPKKHIERVTDIGKACTYKEDMSGAGDKTTLQILIRDKYTFHSSLSTTVLITLKSCILEFLETLEDFKTCSVIALHFDARETFCARANETCHSFQNIIYIEQECLKSEL